MKKGFTLAEVLITLAVIGVVAALTIPVLVNKYQKKQLYSQFMKTYNTIATMMDNAVAENGDIQDWKWGKWKYNEETGEEYREGSEDPVSKYVLTQVKYVKKCDKMSDCFASEYTYLDGSDGSSEQYPDDTLTNELIYDDDYGEITTIVLADGSVVAMAGGRYGMEFAVDTNGKKGPNTYGRDFFMMSYESDMDGYVPGMKLPKYKPNSSYGSNCNPNSNGEENGRGCASRLLEEGKMNY